MKKKLMIWLLLVCLVLTGCGKPAEQEDKKALDPVIVEGLTEAIDNHIQAEITAGEHLPLMVQYNNELLGCIRFRILDFNLSDKAVIVEFTYVDALKLADSFTDPNLTQDGFYSGSIEALQTGKVSTVTEKITVNFQDTGSGYVIVNSEALVNVLSGGVLYYYMELLEDAGYGE